MWMTTLSQTGETPVYWGPGLRRRSEARGPGAGAGRASAEGQAGKEDWPSQHRIIW